MTRTETGTDLDAAWREMMARVSPPPVFGVMEPTPARDPNACIFCGGPSSGACGRCGTVAPGVVLRRRMP